MLYVKINPDGEAWAAGTPEDKPLDEMIIYRGINAAARALRFFPRHDAAWGRLALSGALLCANTGLSAQHVAARELLAQAARGIDTHTEREIVASYLQERKRDDATTTALRATLAATSPGSSGASRLADVLRIIDEQRPDLLSQMTETIRVFIKAVD